jgi:hypothetical protein
VRWKEKEGGRREGAGGKGWMEQDRGGKMRMRMRDGLY